MKENVIAIVITYNPDSALLDNIFSLSPQVNEILIVDNGSKSANVLKALQAQACCKIMNLEKNVGIAAALNIGFDYAINKNYQFVLAMDQDSNPDSNMIEVLLEYYLTMHENFPIGLLGANFRHPQEGNSSGVCSGISEEKIIITSGSLLPVSIFKAVGKFREDYFIDEVDHEYCLRLRSFGYKIYKTKECLMTHSIGNITKHKLLGREQKVFNHNHIRHYYQARNFIVLSKQYRKQEPQFIYSRYKYLRKQIRNCLLFEENRFQKAYYIIKGIVDGLRGRMGKIN